MSTTVFFVGMAAFLFIVLVWTLLHMSHDCDRDRELIQMDDMTKLDAYRKLIHRFQAEIDWERRIRDEIGWQAQHGRAKGDDHQRMH